METATVTNAGVVTGVAAGTSDITYTVTDGNDCSATSPVFVVTVDARPAANITSAGTTICTVVLLPLRVQLQQMVHGHLH